MLNEALKKGNAEAQDFFKQSALETIKNSVTAVDVNACYQQLSEQDKSKGAMTEADPSFQDMVNRHASEIQAIREKAH